MSRVEVEAALDAAASALGAPLGVDGPALLRERADILGIVASGAVSAGGTCRLLRARDERWIAVNLARRSDVELLAAWMEREWNGAPWDAVAEFVASVDAPGAVERAQLLGIPAAVAVEAVAGSPVRMTPGASRRPRGSETIVLDLSALWAGPLCTRILQQLGARVEKVELHGRPDGARAGHPEFWTRMNGGKEERSVDHAELLRLTHDADVVVTSARPRAIEQLGLDLDRRAAVGEFVWVAITGYGIANAWRDRVAFGDDAAVAGGLAVAAGGADTPVFVGDAPADPLAGLHAAAAARRVIEHGLGGVVDVSMRDAVAAALGAARYPAAIQEVA